MATKAKKRPAAKRQDATGKGLTAGVAGLFADIPAAADADLRADTADISRLMNEVIESRQGVTTIAKNVLPGGGISIIVQFAAPAKP